MTRVPEVGGRGGSLSAAPRQEVAGRAKLVIRILSKLGGEASPSLRWLRLCRRPDLARSGWWQGKVRLGAKLAQVDSNLAPCELILEQKVNQRGLIAKF